MDPTPIATAIAAATPIPSGGDPYTHPLFLGVLGIVFTAIVSGVTLLVSRNWVHGDRVVDVTRDAGRRDVDHIERESDILHGASNRELNLIWDELRQLKALSAGQSSTLQEVQLALYKLEVRSQNAEEYIEDQKALTRGRGLRTKAGATT